MDNIKQGASVVLLWKNPFVEGLMKSFVDEGKQKCGGDVHVENLEILEGNEDKYDVAFLGWASPDATLSTDEWGKVLKCLKPSGKLIYVHSSSEGMLNSVILGGFQNGSEMKADAGRYIVCCEKPSFKVGASAPLKFASASNVKKVWTLDEDLDDIVNEDDLLAEEDKIKPDKELLKCATTGKRKACKNCSCGLAEELEAEAAAKNVSNLPKSSCGSCYLGDAFRCASCPYRGLPAFKPGEKIKLDSDILKADA